MGKIIIRIPKLVCVDSSAVAKIAARVDKTTEAVRDALKFETFGEGPDEIRRIAVTSFGAQLAARTCAIPKPEEYGEEQK